MIRIVIEVDDEPADSLRERLERGRRRPGPFRRESDPNEPTRPMCTIRRLDGPLNEIQR